MKNIPKILFLLLSVAFYSQSFKGEIIYSNTYKSKTEQISDEQWGTMLGTTQNYFTQDGNYKSITNGKLFLWQIYLNKENKVYNKMSNSETIYWNDCSVQEDDILKAEINKNVTTILGMQCDEIILECTSGIQRYYFNSSLSTDPDLFKNHKLGNWYDYISRVKAFPLKMIIENKQLVVTSIATKINRKELGNSFFDLPQDVKIEKSK